MAAAPAIGLGLSAVSTVAGLSSQSRQAKAQRAAIEAQNLSARQQTDLMQQRLDASQRTAQDTYLRERVLLDRQSEFASLNLQKVNLEQQLALRQQEFTLSQASAQADIRTQELLTAASAQETQADLANTQTLRALALQVTGNEEEANDIVQRMAVSGLRGATFDSRRRQQELNSVEQFQAAREAMATTERIANTNASNINATADIERRAQDATLGLYRSQLDRQRELLNFANQRLPSILELQRERQELGLQASRDTQAASLQLQQQANQLNLQNTLAANNAAVRSIPQPNLLGSIAQFGNQVLSSGAFNILGNAGTPTFNGSPSPVQPTLFSGFVPGNSA